MHVDHLLQDLRYTLRTLVRDRGFAVVAILVLAIGIGANTAVFSVVNRILLEPLPFNEPDELIWVANEFGRSDAGLSGVTSRVDVFEEWVRRSDAFDDLTSYQAFFAYGSDKLTGRGEPERLTRVPVAQNFFDLLGVRPHLGRLFLEEECQPNSRRAILLTHGFWQRRFGGDPAIVGQSITLDDEPTAVVGVMPATFDFASLFAPGTRIDAFTPLIYDVARNQGNTLAVIGRLAPSATIASARAEFVILVEQLRAERPEGASAFGASLTPLKAHVTGPAARSLVVLWSSVGLVLLIVCANLSSLLLSRATVRRREVALRAALGAERRRLIAQLLTESLVLSGFGALLGLGAAWLAVARMSTLSAVSIPMLAGVTVDATVLAFTVVATVVTGVLFGLAPALQLSRQDLRDAMSEDGRGSTGGRQAPLRSGLVIAEVALACVLLVGAGLLLRSFVEVLNVDLGFDADRTIALRIDPNATYDSAVTRAVYFGEVVRRVRELPGVEAAGVTDALPLNRDRSWGIRASTQEDRSHSAHVRMIGQGYFDAMQITIRDGRDLGPEDAPPAAPVVVLNATAARVLWPDREALGQTIITNDVEHRVVGIVDDVRHSSLEEESGIEMYIPIWRADGSSGDLVMRTVLPPATLAASVKATLRALDPTLPVADLRPMRDLVDRAISPRRFFVSLLSGFAAVALLLAALGIDGVISYGVTQRTREIGVRMALGARALDVQLGVLRQTARLALWGAAIGVVAAFVVARAMRALLFGVSPVDPMTLGGMVLLLATVACLAGYLPARRASRVSPMSALRTG